MAVAILVLQAFAGKRRAPRRAAEHEASRAHIGRGPDEIRDALESEHRVVDEERNRVDAVRGIRGSRGNKRSHRAGFRDALFEDLAVFRFFVLQKRIYVASLLLLADAGINTGRSEK